MINTVDPYRVLQLYDPTTPNTTYCSMIYRVYLPLRALGPSAPVCEQDKGRRRRYSCNTYTADGVRAGQCILYIYTVYCIGMPCAYGYVNLTYTYICIHFRTPRAIFRCDFIFFYFFCPRETRPKRVPACCTTRLTHPIAADKRVCTKCR